MKNSILPVWAMGFAACGAIVGVLFLSSQVQAANTHAVDFESDSQQHLSIDDANQTGLDITGDFTLEAWVKAESISDGDIMAKIDGSGAAYMLNLRDSGKLIVEYVDGSGYTQVITDSTVVSTGTWHHVAVTCDVSAQICEFYVDGIEASSSNLFSGASSVHNISAPFVVGARLKSGGSEKWFDGLIDDVRVWNVIRTAQEISDERDTELNGNETGLVGYWKLNNNLNDSTGNNNTLSNTNSASFVSATPFSGFTEILAARKETNEDILSSTVLQDDNDLQLALAANKTYIIDGVIFASSTSATPDIKLAFTGQTGTNIRIGYTNDVNEMVLDSGDESNRINLPANTPTSIHIKGTVVTSNVSGPFKLKWAQVTSNAASTTVMAGSYIRAQEI